MTSLRRSTASRAPFALLLVCALLLRALIPAGWMPSADGGFRIELCADTGPDAAFEQAARQRFEQAVAGAAGHAGDDERGGDPRKDQPCAFAGLALAWTQPDAFALPAPPPAPAAAPAPALLAAIGQGLAAPPPPSTGPPALS